MLIVNMCTKFSVCRTLVGSSEMTRHLGTARQGGIQQTIVMRACVDSGVWHCKRPPPVSGFQPNSVCAFSAEI